MIRPILACENPYKTAEEFVAIGWKIDFSQLSEIGDPLVGYRCMIILCLGFPKLIGGHAKQGGGF